MPRFTRNFIDKVIDNADTIGIVSRYTKLTKKGSRYFGLCPFPDHNEKTPSFTVASDKPLFYCFGCGKKGSILDFIMQINSMSFTEAVEYLAKEENLTPEYENDGGRSRSYSSKNTLYEINRQSANFYYSCLLKNKGALSYLYNRGIGESAIKTFGLGYSPSDNSLYKFLLQKGFKKEDIIASSLARSNERGVYDYFRDRIMCPIQDVTGHVVGFGGRVMRKGQEPKYLNSPETPVFIKNSTLYNLNRAKSFTSAQPLIMVEGYMDVIALFDRGVKNVCATLGTALGENHAKLIKRFTNDVILCYDGDAAGRNAALSKSSILENNGLNVKVLVLPDEHDPDSYIREYGKEKWDEAVKTAVYTTDFRIGQLLRAYDVNDVNQKSEFLTKAAEAVTEVKDEVKWDYYTRILAEASGADVETVRSRIYDTARRAKTEAERYQDRTVRAGKEEKAENAAPPADKKVLELLGFIMADRDNYEQFVSMGGTAELFESEALDLYRAIEDLYKENTFDISKKLIYNEKVTQTAAAADAYADSFDAGELGERIKTLTKARLNSHLQTIKGRLDRLNGNDTEEEAELLTEYARIKKMLLGLSTEV